MLPSGSDSRLMAGRNFTRFMNNVLSGLIAAPFTPFQTDGSLALPVISQLAALLQRNGVNGAFVCGTTGEGSSLTLPERFQVAEEWRRAAPRGALKLVVHVGHLSLPDACALSRHAQDISADAIAAIAPSFFKPSRVEDLVDWCVPVAAAAPKLPFYYYHMPAMTGVAVTATEFLRHADGRIPSLAGIKFTHEDLVDYRAARAFGNGKYSILFGRDEILLSGLQLGAPGAVGSTYNYATPVYHRIINAYAANNLTAATAEQVKACAFIDVMSAAGGLPAGKAIMGLIGIDCGPVRLPLRQLTSDEIAALRNGLADVGFFDLASRL